MLNHFGESEKILSFKDANKKTAILTSRFFYEFIVFRNLS